MNRNKIKKIYALILIPIIFNFIPNKIAYALEKITDSNTYTDTNSIPDTISKDGKNYKKIETKTINYTETLGDFKTSHLNTWMGDRFDTGGGSWDEGFPNYPWVKNVTQDKHIFSVNRYMNEYEEIITQFCAPGWPRGAGTVINYQGDSVKIVGEEPFVGYGALNVGQAYITSYHLWHTGYRGTVYYGTYELMDETAPTLNLSATPIDWTNGDVTITATAEDTESGLDYITKPDNTTDTNSPATYIVSKNGTYDFKAKDIAGNEVTDSIKISNIDKDNPTITGADDYIQDPTKEEAGTAKEIKINITDPKDNLSIYSGLKYAKLYETTNGQNTLLVNKTSIDGAQSLDISYINNVEGKRSFRLETEDRAGNKVIKEFENDIKPKNEIISLANTYRVYSLNCIDKNTNFGPRNPSLDILTGVYGEMEVTVKGSMLLDAEFYKGNQKINGMFFTGDNMVNYSGVPSKMPLDLKGGDNPNDNKISIKMQDPYLYPYQTQTVKFKFILPNIGTNNVEKDMPISVKLVSYNNTSCVINNVLGKNFFIVKGDVRADLNINNIR